MKYDNKEVVCKKVGNIYVLQFRVLLEYSNKIEHFFTLKYGGNSINEYESLNLGYYSDDDKNIVKQNYIDLCECFNMDYTKLFIPKQIHSDKSIYVDNINCGTLINNEIIECDGSFTNISKIPLVSNSADCITVLLYDKETNYISSIHSGWKGVLNNIVNKTINTMVNKYECKKENIIVCVSPSICKECFEVKQDVYDMFYNLYSDYKDTFIKRENEKYNIDLCEILNNLLIDNDILKDNIHFSNICNKCNSDDFYSYRKNNITGRMGSFIVLK